ncbi:MAG: hypothetical protein U9Q70_08390 [Chloroflexota bacterium]|nr:hypothetical protein [Chloroflexota bacterium]
MSEYIANKVPLEMHSAGWWEQALADQLTAAEERAWLEVEALFKAVPVPVPPAGFADRTLARMEDARRRRYAVGLISAFFLILLAWLLLLATGGDLLYSIWNMGDVLFVSRELLFQTLMRVGINLVAMSRTLFPWLLGGVVLLYFSLMFNGTLAATATLFLVNKRRATVYLK